MKEVRHISPSKCTLFTNKHQIKKHSAEQTKFNPAQQSTPNQASSLNFITDEDWEEYENYLDERTMLVQQQKGVNW